MLTGIIIGIDQPIIPGIMPIQNYASFRRLVNLTKCPVPDSITSDLQPISSDDAAVKRYGAELATKMVNQIIESGLVPGVHFCTLNLEKSVRTILDNLGWSATSKTSASDGVVKNKLIQDDSQVVNGIQINGKAGKTQNPAEDLSISPSEANQLAQLGLTSTTLPPAPKTGLSAQGATGEDSWDEFPNGRFTDVRSPAYGEIDGWGSGLKITAAQALKEWGVPVSTSDLSALFTAYLHSDPNHLTTPFCDLPLSPESHMILPHLLALNSVKVQHWTVGSQPAVDAAKSEDGVVGWGPRGGYVFQKAFVEFFVTEDEVNRLTKKVGEEGKGLITMYAANRKVSTCFISFFVSETWELTWITMIRAPSGPILTRIRSMLSRGVCSPAKRLPNPPSLRKLHSSLGRFVRSFSFSFSAHHTFLRVRLLIIFFGSAGGSIRYLD